MKIVKTVLAFSLILISTGIFGQELPDSYQTMFNEMVTNFETIRSGNSIKEGKSTLSVFNENKIVLRTQHKKQVRNLTFLRKPDKENKLLWIAGNPLTIDLINKYEDDFTEILESLYELSIKKSKE